MSKLEKLEAVALAAKELNSHIDVTFPGEKVGVVISLVLNLAEKIHALDACPQAEPASRALDAFCKAAWPGAEPVEGRPERPEVSVDTEPIVVANSLTLYANRLEAYATTLEQRLGVKP